MINKLINAKHAISHTFVLEQAKTLKRQNKIEEAIEILEKANKDSKDNRIIHLLANFLLDSGNYQRIIQLSEIQKVESRCYAIAQYLANISLNNTDPLCLEGHQPLSNAAFITMIKDEEDIILFNLIWHYHLGLRKFFIIDNLSTDQTLQQIKLFENLFEDTRVFILHDPIVAHYQGKKITGATRFVMSLWPEIEWFFLVDADEFLCSTQPVHQVLSAIPASVDAIVVSKSMYILTSQDAAENNDLFFRRIQHRKPLTHISNKLIIRANFQVEISQGNHRLFSINKQEINYQSVPYFSYREFPIRSHQHYLQKTKNGGRAIAEAKQQGFNQVGGNHWEAAYNLYLKEGEAGVRKRLNTVITKNANEATIFDPFPLVQITNKLNITKDLLS
jgi:hypothetical protein